RQLGTEQRAAGRLPEIDDGVRPPGVKSERPARTDGQLGAVAVAEVRAGRAHGWDGDAQRPLDDGALGGPLRLDADVLPLAAATGPEQRARGRHAVGAGALDLGQLGPGDPPLLAFDPRADALAGRGQGDEGGAAVA